MSDSIMLLESVRLAVRTRITGATAELIDQETREVVSEILRETLMYRVDKTVTLEAGVTDYTLTMDDYESVAVLVGASYQGRGLSVGRPSVTLPYDAEATGGPRFVFMLDDQNVRVHPSPTADNEAGKEITLDCAMTILPVAEVILPKVLRPYQMLIQAGVLARMYSMPERPWTSKASAASAMLDYESRRVSARNDTERGRARRPTFARFPPFA